MNVEEIPSDELAIMTEFWHKAFNAAGCDPMCHCCENMIAVNDKFKLSTIKRPNGRSIFSVDKENIIKLLKGAISSFSLWGSDRKVEIETHEVMLCEKCTPEKFVEKQISLTEKELEESKSNRKGGCFRVNGKIIH